MIRYATSLEGLRADQLTGPFFEGWPSAPDPETHLELLHGSDHVVLAVRDEDQSVVGFATAISDGVLAAYIPFLEVLPDYRGRGIGSELIRILLTEIGDVYMVDAMVDPEFQPFYRHLGMQPATGVVIRNYERQAGRPVSDPS